MIIRVHFLAAWVLFFLNKHCSLSWLEIWRNYSSSRHFFCCCWIFFLFVCFLNMRIQGFCIRFAGILCAIWLDLWSGNIINLPITTAQSVLAFMCLISVRNLITGLSCSGLQPIAMHLLYSLGRRAWQLQSCAMKNLYTILLRQA